MFVTKRFPFIVFGLSISFVFIMIITSISQLIFIFAINNKYLGYIIGNIVYFLSIYLLLYFINLKNWMILHNHYITTSKQQEWMKIINPSNLKKMDKNSQNYKNHRIIKRCAIIFGIIHFLGFFISLLSTLFIINDPNQQYHVIEGSALNAILLSPFIIFYIIKVCQTPYFKDIFWIFHENKIYSKLLCGLGLINIMYATLFMMVDRDKYWIYIVILCLSTVSIFTFILCYISTYIVLNKNDAVNNIHKRLSLDKVPSSSCYQEIKLDMILSNNDALDLFVEHLNKQFSFFCFGQYLLKRPYFLWSFIYCNPI